MKRFSKLAALLSAGALLFGGLFLSCSDDDDDGDKDTVTSIYVEVGSTAKTTYTAGDTFDATGITVYGLLNSYTVTGSDPVDSTKVKKLTDGITYKAGDTTLDSGSTAMTTAMTKVTVTYGNYSDSFDITVNSDTDNVQNTVSGTGTASDPYVLTSSLAETIQGKANALDAFKYQSQTSHDTDATLIWDNPLYGTSASDLTDGITVQVDVYSPDIEYVNGYDALITFFKTDDAWNALSVMEGGAVHMNSAAIGGYYDNVSSLKKAEWTTVSLVFGTDGTMKYYQGTEPVDGTGTITAFENVTVSYNNFVTYFTETVDKVAVGVGFTADELWLAGYVDDGSAIANFKIYKTALTAAQIAGESNSGSGATAQITASASWDFASLAGTACKAVDASTALADAAALAAASVTATSFTDGLTKFSIQEDVAYTATSGSGSLTIKALGNDEKPIQYNKYEATTTKGDGSAGCLQIKNDAIVIAGVQGPFTIEAVYGSNASSAKTGRNMYFKVGGETVKESESTIPVDATGFSFAYEGTDIVDVVVGATDICRLYDVKITK